MNILFYDCEIVKMIPGKGPQLPGYRYCAGWHDHANMGISVIGYYSTTADAYGYAIASSESFEVLVSQHDLIAGFNSRKFDDRLCAANGINIRTGYDLLEEIRIAAYGSTSYQACPKGRSYALGWLGEANGHPKTGSGELAPKLWQDGRHQDVIDYCLNDVELTVKLFTLGINGNLKDPNTGEMLQLRSPFN